MSLPEVSDAMARLFFDQCIGTHAGHMADIPNNPVLHSIVLANGINTWNPVAKKKEFAGFLIGVANRLIQQADAHEKADDVAF